MNETSGSSQTLGVGLKLGPQVCEMCATDLVTANGCGPELYASVNIRVEDNGCSKVRHSSSRVSKWEEVGEGRKRRWGNGSCESSSAGADHIRFIVGTFDLVHVNHSTSSGDLLPRVNPSLL